MSNRIITVSVNDIIIDPEGQSRMITEACRRETAMTVTGTCQVGDNILFILEEANPREDLEYVIAPLGTYNIDEIITEIGTRYFSGFSLIGSFDIKSDKWAIFKLRSKES